MRSRRTPLLYSCLAGLLVAATMGCETSQPVRTTRPSQTIPNQYATPDEPGSRMVKGWPSRRTGGGTAWSSMAYPTGDASSSAVGIEKGMPREVMANKPFEYQIVVTNLTSRALEDIVDSERPTGALTINSATPQASTGRDGAASWSIGSLGPRESQVIRVNSSAANEGEVGSCTTVSYASLLCATIPVVSPKLALVKTGPAEVLKCEDITYRFEVSNTGTGTVRGVKINDPLPTGLTADGKQVINFDIGTLAAGEKKSVSRRVKASRSGRFNNQATATAEGGMTASSGQVTTVVKQPVLTITKTCPERVFIGRAMNAQITVKNTGDGPARDCIVEDSLPAGAKFESASDGGRMTGGNVRWSLGTLEPGATKTLSVQMTSSRAGTFRDTATARAFCADSVTASCSTEVTGIPAILLEVIDIEDPIQVGTNETYEIKITNQGSAPDTNIRIVVTLEANQQHVSNSGPTNGTARGNQVTFDPIPTLAPKQVVTYRVVARSVAPGDVRFAVTMTSDQLTRPVQETEATNIYE